MKNYEHLGVLFADHLRKFNSSLEVKTPAELYQPCNYILSLGGKRLRPLLALVACELFGENPNKALDSALSVELFHNFSLVHDDILDEAPLRRNQPTVHLKWNRNIAILSGDALLVKSLQVLNTYPPEEASKLSELMCTTAMQVCEGQQLDMNFEKQNSVSIDEYIRMIEYKTAVLLGCSLKMGAINARANSMQQNDIYTFGVNLGIAFQLLDDLLDAFAQNSELFGKRPGGDILANKKTFLLLKAIALANVTQKKEIASILALPGETGHEKINRMLQIYNDLGIKTYCEQSADAYTNAAIASLNGIQADPGKKKHLHEFANQLLNRQV
ncbi:MAG: polyprenyl synthetase family protein [Bacteroidia bacterium]|nr:polyprenyl synthetase family protein [Bacteroidia bacterium]